VIENATSTNGFTDSAALALLLTTESLLFAALSVSVTLAQPVAGGRPPFLARGRLGIVIALVLTVVAVGGLSAWLDVFSDPWPDGFRDIAVAVGLGAGIVGQALFAWVIVIFVRKD
jgi:hypothetical protein